MDFCNVCVIFFASGESERDSLVYMTFCFSNNVISLSICSTLSSRDMSREDKVEHIDKLITLLEKQKVMYTRLSLSDSPEAKKMTQTLQKSISSMGFPPGTDMQILFSSMNETIQTLKQDIN